MGPVEEYQLYLETPESEVLLARKTARRNVSEEPPSSPSRFYGLLAGQNGEIDWLGGHLGCKVADRGYGLVMEPRVFFQVGQNSRISFVHSSPAHEDPMTLRMDLSHINPVRACTIRVDGRDSLKVQLKQTEGSRIVMGVFNPGQHEHPLKMAFVPLLIGPRSFFPPADANRAPWHVLR